MPPRYDRTTHSHKPTAQLAALIGAIRPTFAEIEEQVQAFTYDPNSPLPEFSAAIGQRVYAHILAASALYLIDKGPKHSLNGNTAPSYPNKTTPLIAPTLLSEIPNLRRSYLDKLSVCDDQHFKQLSQWKDWYHLLLADIINRYGYTNIDLSRVHATLASLIKPTEAFTATVNDNNNDNDNDRTNIYRETLTIQHELTKQQISTIKRQRVCNENDPVQYQLQKDFSFNGNQPRTCFFRRDFTCRTTHGIDNSWIYTVTLPTNNGTDEKTLRILMAGNVVAPHAKKDQVVEMTQLNYSQLINAALKTRIRPDHDNIQEYVQAYQHSWARETQSGEEEGEGEQEEKQDAQTEGCRPVLIDLSLLSPMPVRIPGQSPDNDDHTAEKIATEAAALHNKTASPIKIIRATVPLNEAGALLSSVIIKDVLEHYKELLSKNQQILRTPTHQHHAKLREIQKRYRQLQILKTLSPELDHLIPTVILLLADLSDDLVHMHCKSSKDRFNTALTVYLAVNKIQLDEGEDIIDNLITQFGLFRKNKDNEYLKATDKLTQTCNIFQNRPSTLWILAYSGLGQYWAKITGYSFARLQSPYRALANSIPALKDFVIKMLVTGVAANYVVSTTANKPNATSYLKLCAMTLLAMALLIPPLRVMYGQMRRISCCKGQSQPLKRHKPKTKKLGKEEIGLISIIAAIAGYAVSTAGPAGWFEATFGEQLGEILNIVASSLASLFVLGALYCYSAKQLASEEYKRAKQEFDLEPITKTPGIKEIGVYSIIAAIVGYAVLTAVPAAWFADTPGEKLGEILHIGASSLASLVVFSVLYCCRAKQLASHENIRNEEGGDLNEDLRVTIAT